MSVEKWVNGAVAAFTSLDTTALNSIANGNAIQSSQVDNSTALDLFADIELDLAALSPVAPNYVGVYLYPINQDGSTFGDGRFTASAAGPPPSQYMVGTLGYYVATTTAEKAQLRGIVLPPSKFKFVLYNQMGVAFASSGNVLYYKTYGLQAV